MYLINKAFLIENLAAALLILRWPLPWKLRWLAKNSLVYFFRLIESN